MKLLIFLSSAFVIIIGLGIILPEDSSPQQSIDLTWTMPESYDQTEKERKEFRTPAKARVEAFGTFGT